MPYCNQDDVSALININDVAAMLDDTGAANLTNGLTVLNNLISLHSALIDGSIANIIDVPVIPTPPLLRAACAVFVCESMYQRRLTPDEKNPFKPQADMMRERLKAIGHGDLEFDLNYPRDYPQGAVVSTPLTVNMTTL
jgi:hypothetical protein